MGRKDARAKRPASDRRKIIPIKAIIQKYIGTMKLSKRSRGRAGLTKRHAENHHDMLSIKLQKVATICCPGSAGPGTLKPVRRPPPFHGPRGRILPCPPALYPILEWDNISARCSQVSCAALSSGHLPQRPIRVIA